MVLRLTWKSGPCATASRREAAGEDADAGAVLVGALPGDDEVAVGVGSDRGTSLVSRSVGVDLELAAQRRTARVETLRENALAVAVLPGVALPGDDEVAIGVGGDDRATLDAAGVGVDLELAGERRARGVEAAGEDAALVAVLTVLSQATTKSPSPSDATAASNWLVTVMRFTWNSAATGAPFAWKRRAKTPEAPPSWPLLCQTTTKPPSSSTATAG